MLQGTQDFVPTMDSFLPCMLNVFSCFLSFPLSWGFDFVTLFHLLVLFCKQNYDMLLFCLPGETSQLE